jgi:hypothetical protein
VPRGPQLQLWESLSWHLLLLDRPALLLAHFGASSLVFYAWPPHYGSIGDYGSFTMMYSLWFLAPCLPERACEFPEGSLGSICGFVHLCTPCQSLVQGI